MMTKQELEQTGLIEMFVMGLTDEEESAAVRKAMAENPELRSEIESLQKAFDSYINAHATVPPAELKGKVMQSIDSPASTNAQDTPKWSIWSLAAVIIFALLSGLVLFQNNNLQRNLEEAEAGLVACEEEKASIISANAAYAANESFMNDPQTRKVLVSGTEKAPEAVILAFYNPAEEKSMYQILNLPPLSKDKCYQMWADVDGKMINMGVLTDDYASMAEANFIARAESFNVTIEDAGGAEHPTVSNLIAVGEV